VERARQQGEGRQLLSPYKATTRGSFASVSRKLSFPAHSHHGILLFKHFCITLGKVHMNRQSTWSTTGSLGVSACTRVRQNSAIWSRTDFLVHSFAVAKNLLLFSLRSCDGRNSRRPRVASRSKSQRGSKIARDSKSGVETRMRRGKYVRRQFRVRTDPPG